MSRWCRVRQKAHSGIRKVCRGGPDVEGGRGRCNMAQSEKSTHVMILAYSGRRPSFPDSLPRPFAFEGHIPVSVTRCVTNANKTKNPHKAGSRKSLKLLVGAAGFELATPCTPCKCATRLRYAPTAANYNSKSRELFIVSNNLDMFSNSLRRASGARIAVSESPIDSSRRPRAPLIVNP